jgi:hypothetical protein
MHQAEQQRRPLGDLRQRQHPPCPRRHRLPGRPSPAWSCSTAPGTFAGTSVRGGTACLPMESRLQSDQIKMIRARRSAFLAQFPTRRVGSQTTHAPERLSRYVIIAGCGYRAISADMVGCLFGRRGRRRRTEGLICRWEEAGRGQPAWNHGAQHRGSFRALSHPADGQAASAACRARFSLLESGQRCRLPERVRRRRRDRRAGGWGGPCPGLGGS